MTAPETSPVAAMTDDELVMWRDEAYGDLLKAAAEKPNSEWHSTCFFALREICEELNRRGIRNVTLH